MAATDLVYNTVDPVLFTPDYAFLRYNLDKKQARYDQGLDAVSKAYNKLKSEVTDPVNRDRRDQFLKDAQGQLQKIASSDLSLAENINSANNVFDPLATNPAFIYDAYITKQVKEANQEMNEWANSPVEEIRKKYSSEVQRWVNRDLDVLREGKGDINNYKKVQNRKALAILDPQDILAKAAKEQGFQFKVDTAGNPYIITTEGGTAGVPSYNAFANAILGSNQAYQRQLQVLGEARSEDVLDLYKNRLEWQGKTDQEKFIDYGIQSRSKHRLESKSYLDGLEKSLTKEDADIAAYFNANQSLLNQGKNDVAAGNNGTPAAQALLEFQTRTSNRNSLKTKLGEEQNIFNQTYGSNSPDDLTFATNFAKNPKSFFSDQQLKNDVQTFTNIKASSVSRTIKADTAYVSLENARLTGMKNTWNMIDDMIDNTTDQEKLALKEMQLNAKGQKTQRNADGTTSIVPSTGAEITVGSASATDLYIINALDKLKERVTIAKSNALQSMTSPIGALAILPSFGLSNEETGIIKTLYSKQLSSDDPTKAIGLTANDKKVMSSLRTKAAAFAKNAGIDFDENAFANMTVKDIPFLVSKAMAGYTPKNMGETNAMKSMEDYNKNMDVLQQTSAALEKGRQAVAAVYGDSKAHPEFAGMFTTKNGSPALIDETDIEKQIPKIANGVALDDATRKQIAKEYIDGTLETKVTIPSVPFYTTAIPGFTDVKLSNGKTITFESTRVFNIQPKKYQELIKKINTETPIPDYVKEQGNMLSNPRFLLTGKTMEKMALELSDATQSNANIFEYAGTAQEKQVDDSKKQIDIRGAMKNKENIAGITVLSASPLNNGKMAVAVTMNSTKREDSKKEFWEGQTYYFPINVNETTPEILRIFGQVNEVGEFEKYKKEGKDFTIDLFQGTGIKAVIHPNMAGDNNVIIEVMYKPWDPKTKSYLDWQPLDPMNPTTSASLDQISFPEIKENLYQQIIYPHVEQYIRRQKDNLTSAGLTDKPLTLESFLK